MGSFSWMYATAPSSFNDVVNVVPGDEVKVLIPEEFGGGCIEGVYRDYGQVQDANGIAYDLYELLALWNSSTLRDTVKEYAREYNDESLARKECDNFGKYEYGSSVSDVLRIFAIDWSHLNDGDEASDLHYGLKIVRPEDSVSYEECKYLSGHDRHQGFYPVPLGMLSDSGSDVEEVWLRAVKPPRFPRPAPPRRPDVSARKGTLRGLPPPRVTYSGSPATRTPGTDRLVAGHTHNPEKDPRCWLHNHYNACAVVVATLQLLGMC